MAKRTIVHIDEEKCDGCGQCVPSCEEGAIQIINGKAKLVSDVYCDGLGACLGQCPQDAIRLIERDAQPFDQRAVAEHLGHGQTDCQGTCPGTQQAVFPVVSALPIADGKAAQAVDLTAQGTSSLANWPVQLRLVSPEAPFLQGADILLVADCVPFAMADFHQRLLDGRPVIVACPKLDPLDVSQQRLDAIISWAQPKSVTIVYMEVPCCGGLLRMVQRAIEASGRSVPVEQLEITRRGLLRSECP